MDTGRGMRVAIIAAAGRGKRFQGQGPKVLAEVDGKPCLSRVVEAVEEGLGEHRQIIVVGDNAAMIEETIGQAPGREYVRQPEPRGTGDALRQGLKVIADHEAMVYFFCGDKPMLTGRTIRRFREQFESGSSPMQFLTGRLQGDERELLQNTQGRVVCVPCQERQHALGIVERKVIDAMEHGQHFPLANGEIHYFTREQLLLTREINVSTYAWWLPMLRLVIGDLSDRNAQGEFLVTDMVQHFIRRGWPVETMALLNQDEGRGIDTVEQLQAISGR